MSESNAATSHTPLLVGMIVFFFFMRSFSYNLLIHMRYLYVKKLVNKIDIVTSALS